MDNEVIALEVQDVVIDITLRRNHFEIEVISNINGETEKKH